jgi:hypothetical protein
MALWLSYKASNKRQTSQAPLRPSCLFWDHLTNVALAESEIIETWHIALISYGARSGPRIWTVEHELKQQENIRTKNSVHPVEVTSNYVYITRMNTYSSR